MEPLSLFTASATVLSVFEMVNEAIKILRSIKNLQDPKVEQIYYNLLAQKTITAGLANRIRAEGDWFIPPESREYVAQIMEQMKTYCALAEKKMTRVRHHVDGKMTPKVLAERVWFQYGGFAELKELTDAMDSMNRALIALAPPLPSYLAGASHEPSRPVEPQAETEGIATQQAASSAQLAVRGGEFSEPPAPEISMVTLYYSCVEVLDLLAREAPEYPLMESFCKRLKQWGSDLFQGPASLDIILRENNAEEGPLGMVVNRCLIFIALIEGMTLKKRNCE